MTDGPDSDASAASSIGRPMGRRNAGEKSESDDQHLDAKIFQKNVRARLAFIEVTEHLGKMAIRINAVSPKHACRLEKHGLETVIFHLSGNCCTLRFAFFGPNGSDVDPGFHLSPSVESKFSIRFFYLEHQGKSGWQKEGAEGAQEIAYLNSRTIADWTFEAATNPAEFIRSLC